MIQQCSFEYGVFVARDVNEAKKCKTVIDKIAELRKGDMGLRESERNEIEMELQKMEYEEK
jgi:hypothetical protein